MAREGDLLRSQELLQVAVACISLGLVAWGSFLFGLQMKGGLSPLGPREKRQGDLGRTISAGVPHLLECPIKLSQCAKSCAQDIKNSPYPGDASMHLHLT